MINATIYAEYRAGAKLVLLERVQGDWGEDYRVTVCRRSHNLPKAKAVFLSNVPASARDRFEKQITEAAHKAL